MPALRHIVLSAALGIGAAGLVGCTMERPLDVPSSASLVSEGDGKLTYRATGPGTVYVYDQTADRIVYSGKVDTDDLIELDPRDNKLTVDGRTVSEELLRSGNQHRIFFDHGTEKVVVERETRIERRDTD